MCHLFGDFIFDGIDQPDTSATIEMSFANCFSAHVFAYINNPVSIDFDESWVFFFSLFETFYTLNYAYYVDWMAENAYNM